MDVLDDVGSRLTYMAVCPSRARVCCPLNPCSIANVVRQEMNSEMKRREIKRYYQERYSSLEKQPEAWKTDAGREHVRQPRYEKFSAIERIHGKVGGTNAQERACDATWLDFFEVKGAVDFDGRNVGDQNPRQ